MILTLYDVQSDRNVVDKTIQKIKDISFTCKGDVIIESPTLELGYDNDLISYSYVYIPAWDRYYYITDREVSAQRIYISLEVDPLMSFKDDLIHNTSGVVRRSAGSWNRYLNDPKLQIYSYQAVQTKALSGSDIDPTKQSMGMCLVTF